MGTKQESDTRESVLLGLHIRKQSIPGLLPAEVALGRG